MSLLLMAGSSGYIGLFLDPLLHFFVHLIYNNTMLGISVYSVES